MHIWQRFRWFCGSLLVALNLGPVVVAFGVPPQLDRYNVAWDSPSQNAHGSMPLGNGDVGINAWVEPSGDLVFYISKTDAWDENGRLCKIGRVRVKFDPPLAVARGFRQELKLAEGRIAIEAGGTKLSLWVDANRPVVRMDAETPAPATCRATVELWRLRERPFGGGDDSHSGNGLAGSAFKPTVLPDRVVPSDEPRVVWYHRNTRSIFDLTLKVQHLDALVGKFVDPLLNLTFGASLSGDGLARDGAQAVKSAAPSNRHGLAVTVLTAQTNTPEAWLDKLAAAEKTIAQIGLAESRRAHEAWWRDYWERSWVFVEDCAVAPMPANQQPWRVGIDSNQTSRFGGEIAEPQVLGRALSPEEIARLAAKRPQGDAKLQGADAALTNGCTATAWIKPAAGEVGRILDKCTAGTPDGITLDTYPGLSLRWIVGDHTMVHPNCLKADQWQHVAATADPATGTRRIYLDGKLVKEERTGSPAEILTRGYVLQRFMNACSGRGGSPIKFNGSIFTVEATPGAPPETPAGDPDWRQWGGNYWFQNTRLAYWSMLAAGDFDMMTPWFDMYRKALPLGRARINAYYGFDNAAQFAETMYFWGLPNNGDYGWGNSAPEPVNTFIRRYWNGSLELVAAMLDRYDFTEDQTFARDTLVPLADPLINFLVQYWSKRDAAGKIRMEPAQSLETWHVAVNPMPEIAGLRFLLPRLLQLPEGVATADQRTRWRKMLEELPPAPTAVVGGVKLLRPAETFSQNSNSENPELYAVFPYRLFGAGRPDLQMARDTYARRGNKHNIGWCQDSIQAACLGLGDEAGRLVAARAAHINTGHRFPVMWGPNFDWIPDQDHGNNILTTLHTMLVQSDGDKLYVLPAWPKSWNVAFKLHSPRQTTIEGIYRSGKLEQLRVVPESRRKDMVVASAGGDPADEAHSAQLERLRRHSFESTKADPAAPGLLLGNVRLGGCLAASGLGIPKLWAADVWSNADLRLPLEGPLLACEELAGKTIEYRQSLSLTDGLARTSVRYRPNVGYDAEVFCSMADPSLMVMRVAYHGEQESKWSLDVPANVAPSKEPSGTLSGKTPDHVFTPYAWTLQSDRPVTHVEGRRFSFKLRPGEHATLLFRLKTAAPKDTAGTLPGGDFDALFARHRAAWGALWLRCAVLVLPDPEIERLWYRSVYWTLSTCGSDRYLPGESMFCVPCWSMHPFTYGAAGWAVQAFTALGLPERAKAMLDCHFRPAALRDNARFYTRALAAKESAAEAMAFAHEVKTDGRNIPCGHYELQRHLDGFAAALFYRHQRFYPGQSYSSAELYPLMKGLAEMWCGVAQRDAQSGDWLLPRMTSLTEDLVAPHPIDAALAAKWCLLIAHREAAAIGCDAQRRDHWREVAEHLRIPHNGERYIEFAGDSGRRPGGGYQGVRGFVYLGYPTMELIPTLDREKALRTLDHTWDRNLKGAGMIGFVASWFALADLHYGRGDHALEILRHNFRCEDAWHQGISETPGSGNYHFTTNYTSCLLVPLAMAVQSADGRIDAFHAVPSAWKDFAFYRVPAESGVRVSGAMRDGRVQWLTYSNRGQILRRSDRRESLRIRREGDSVTLLASP